MRSGGYLESFLPFEMEKFHLLFLLVIFSFGLFHGGIARVVKSPGQGGSEEWGYVQVRPSKKPKKKKKKQLQSLYKSSM